MKKLVLQFILYTVSISLAGLVIPGVDLAGALEALVAGLVMSLAGLLIRPWLMLLSLPLNLITMGLFTLVINALMVLLISLVTRGVEVAGFWPALGTAVLVTLVDFLLRNLRRKD
ncbi:putative membrane protein [Desulfotomaculum arcticum]|uniref:Putative membrane protein n=1 Tax=Desulfotruncus arcticus DSM 17038 TaxID=1121424 RepID=A0A1I2SXR4_9FIRM|nr:phage holin family protein [Desulfotruncus arcticus]SFG57514.1 putative membrane protein [Desulfotomaculum arcticum] [Desulfotruncus arcticus DSM 17038]